MYHIIVLFLDSFYRVFIHLIWSLVRDRLLRYYLIFLVLFVQLHFQVVLLRVNLVGKFGLLDDVSHEFKFIQEQEELPY